MSEDTRKKLTPEVARRLYARQSALMLFAVGSMAALCASMGCFSSLHLACEISAQFYCQYTVTLAIAIVGLLLLRRWKASLFLSAFLAVCVAQLLPLYMSPGQPATAGGSRIRVATINVRTENKDYQGVAAAINEAKPDIVSLEEIDKTWLNQLRQLVGKDYPEFYAYPAADNFGIGIFSKLPLHNADVHVFGGVNLPSVIASVDVAGKPVTILALHAFPPMTDAMMKVRNREIDGLIAEKQMLGERFIILGDFNCARWSSYFKGWLHGLNAADTSVGFGVQPSWPAKPLILRIPIDHILTSKNFVTARRWIGPQTGSDHLPVFADLLLQR